MTEELDAPVLDDFDQIPTKKQCSALPHSKSDRKIIPKLPWSPSKPGPSAYNVDTSAENDSNNHDDTHRVLLSLYFSKVLPKVKVPSSWSL